MHPSLKVSLECNNRLPSICQNFLITTTIHMKAIPFHTAYFVWLVFLHRMTTRWQHLHHEFTCRRSPKQGWEVTKYKYSTLLYLYFTGLLFKPNTLFPMYFVEIILLLSPPSPKMTIRLKKDANRVKFFEAVI